MKLPANHGEILQTYNRLCKLEKSIALLSKIDGDKESEDVKYFLTQKKSYEDHLAECMVSDDSREYLMWLKLNHA